ncbi:MAG TPA: hypothetical protein PKZ32_02855 [Candidatus Melainabacteria bacterium]|nr:hypothetical protein [Candidatus Melainabacteria bacterium]
MNLHNLQTRLGLILAGLSLVTTVGFFAQTQSGSQSSVSEPDIPSLPLTYTEVRPEATGESYRVHVRAANGVESAVRIHYLDGSQGALELYADGDTKEEVRLFLDKSVRKRAVYDATGQLTEGFEYRPDRTLLWKASSDMGKTVTESYWPSGQLFLERTYDWTSRTTTTVFYRETGSIWQETVIIGDNVHLDDSGKIEFEQVWGHSAEHYYDPSSGVPNPNPLVIKSVALYEQGTAALRFYLTASGRLHLIDKYSGDSTERLTVQSNGDITQIEVISAGGSRAAQYDFNGKFGKAPILDSRYRLPLPDRAAPFKQFNDIEEALAKR